MSTIDVAKEPQNRDTDPTHVTPEFQRFCDRLCIGTIRTFEHGKCSADAQIGPVRT
jgi:hypothetical protein